MKKLNLWKITTFSLVVVLVVTLAIFYLPNGKKVGSQMSNDGAFALVKPAFLKSVNTLAGTDYLTQEAGITVYANVNQAINLKAILKAFRTIEYQTNDYIIGSIPLPNYDQNQDVHVFVHRTGWIVSYYLKSEPTSKIFDLKDYINSKKVNGTKLESALKIVCDAGGITLTGVNLYYYHFRYPNATKLMIIADYCTQDHQDGSNRYKTFRIKLPSSFSFYEFSFSHCAVGRYRDLDSELWIDNTQIDSLVENQVKIDLLDANLFLPDLYHTIKITRSVGGWVGDCLEDGYGAIVLVYKEG